MGKGEGWGEGQGQGCGQGAGGEDWQNSLCSCCSGDMSNCFCGTFCFPCQSYQIAERMGKSGIVYGLLGWILPFVPPLIMRGDVRDLNNIEGSTCNDALAACCCTCCASIQIANELDSRLGKV